MSASGWRVRCSMITAMRAAHPAMPLTELLAGLQPLSLGHVHHCLQRDSMHAIMLLLLALGALSSELLGKISTDQLAIKEVSSVIDMKPEEG